MLYHLSYSARHYRVINWTDFNIVVSQGIGRHEERERDKGTIRTDRV
jgi:hypothetical protein